MNEQLYNKMCERYKNSTFNARQIAAQFTHSHACKYKEDWQTIAIWLGNQEDFEKLQEGFYE